MKTLLGGEGGDCTSLFNTLVSRPFQTWGERLGTHRLCMYKNLSDIKSGDRNLNNGLFDTQAYEKSGGSWYVRGIVHMMCI